MEGKQGRRKERKEGGVGYVRVFSRGKTSRVVARLVNTRHPSTVDWGVNLSSKYIYIYILRVHHVCARSKLPSYFWPRGCNHQYTDYATRLNWFQTNLEILGICSTFWTFSICIPLRPFLSHPSIPILLLFALRVPGRLWFPRCNRAAPQVSKKST